MPFSYRVNLVDLGVLVGTGSALDIGLSNSGEFLLSAQSKKIDIWNVAQQKRLRVRVRMDTKRVI